MWDLIVSVVPDHCLSFLLSIITCKEKRAVPLKTFFQLDQCFSLIEL